MLASLPMADFSYAESIEGGGREQMAEMQKLVNAEYGDVFDLLAYVAYAPLCPNSPSCGRHRSM
jgi:hypothetical protein